MKRIAALLALLCFSLAQPVFAADRPPSASPERASAAKGRATKTHRRSVRTKELGLAASMLFFGFLLPLPAKQELKTAKADVNDRSHKGVDKGSAIKSQ